MALTIDGSDPTGDLGDLLAAKLDASAPVGKILQVVSTVKTDTFTESVAAGSTSGAVTGLSLSITPSLATSKVCILYTVSGVAAGPNAIFVKLFRAGNLSSLVGDVSGSRQRSTTIIVAPSDSEAFSSTSGVFIDTPSTTSATTYDIRLGHSSSITRVVHVNRATGTASDNFYATGASSLTLLEVGA